MIPGARIPIRGLDALDQDSPDEVLILTWNLAAEVVRLDRADGGHEDPVSRCHPAAR